MAQITMNIQTMDWTMGETVGLHLMVKKDCKARIAWGDGKVQVVTGKLEKTLKRNSPYKVRGGSFGDYKIKEVSNGKIVGEYEGKL